MSAGCATWRRLAGVLAAVALSGLADAGLADAASAAPTPAPPRIPASAWILLDARDGARLAAYGADRSLPMASTTKLMTAYVALHGVPLGRRLAAPAYHPIPGESLVGLQPGERMSVRDLLYGLLLPSGNDAAATLAAGIAGSEATFVRRMNRAARTLGLRDTSYANPIGLDQPGNYSSPEDLATLALALRREPIFRRIVDTPRAELRTGAHPRTVVNRNDLVLRVPWINGVKTGYTPDAGNVLVASGTRRGVTLLSVVMGAPSIRARDDDTLSLLRYGFSLYEPRAAIRAGEVLAHTRVENGDRGLALVAGAAVRAMLRPDQRPKVSVRAPGSVEAPIRRGERLGQATVTVGGRPVGQAALVARHPVDVAGGGSLVERADDVLPGPRAAVWALGVAAGVIIVVGTVAAVGRRRPAEPD